MRCTLTTVAKGAVEVPATGEELRACCDILRRLKPEHLRCCEELRTVGAALFKPLVLRQEFGSKSAVEFLQEVLPGARAPLQ